ncbi:hypothetical protein EC973_002112 [Apophysomyces ossiformis]|uniref:Cation/H+ exchanger domain-containing protein n=1 Tax=Apophysomyces ossiformis TaxID=679940 RepID=A0A8H7BP75_9FUNG|nr:hypothetical protein EC973_002112 [Apophysomyces ossiformis]
MLAVAVLLFRRLPAIVGLYRVIPAIRNVREAFFTGWFGPIGVGAIFYLTVAAETISSSKNISIHAKEVIEPIIYFMVLASVLVHGITIPCFYLGSMAKRTLSLRRLGSKDQTPKEVSSSAMKAILQAKYLCMVFESSF